MLLLLFLHFLTILSFGESKEEMRVSLQTGKITGSSKFLELLESPKPGFGWTKSPIYLGKKGRLCNLQAVLKVSLVKPFVAVKLKLEYAKPRFWTFHLSQDIFANGFGQTTNGQFFSKKPQLHVSNRELRIYATPALGANSSSNLVFSKDKLFPVTEKFNFTVEIKEKRMRFYLNNEKQEKRQYSILSSENLFGISARESLFIGLNRLIGEPSRYGYGLCAVTMILKKPRDERGQCVGKSFELCDKHAACSQYRKKSRCRCNPGFKGNGKSCRDVNECTNNNGGCVHNCENVEGSYRCSCFPGFQLDPSGRDCFDLDECSRNHSGPALLCSQVCINTLGSFRCECEAGFLLASDGRSCFKAVSGSVCSKKSCSHSCNEFLDSCTCPSGYRLASDQRSCIQTCQVGNGGCHHLCFENDAGQPACGCQPKYILGPDNRTCVGTCALDNGDCKGSLCLDTHSGTRCRCHRGFKLSRNDSKSCQDINECLRNNGRCQSGCRNFRGGYECTCPSGFILDTDGRTCNDVNECLYNDTCEHFCENTPGSFRCSCRPGYQTYAVTKCADMDECSENQAHCQYRCVNTPGRYHCTCPEQMVIHPNGKDCIALNRHCDTPWSPVVVSLGELSRTTVNCRRDQVLALRPGLSYSFSCGLTNSYRCKSSNTIFIHLRVDSCLWAVRQISEVKKMESDASPDCSMTLQLCHFNVACQKDDTSGDSFVVLSATLSSNLEMNSKLKLALLNQRIAETVARGDLKMSIQKMEYWLRTVDKTGQSNRTYSCSFGSYYNDSVGYCLPCPAGFYKAQNKNPMCLRCPNLSQSNVKIGAMNIEQCEGLCLAGRYSSTGSQPCMPCPIGFYQPNRGRTVCIPCGGKIRTSFQGSTAFSDCIISDSCEAGFFFNTSTAVCRKCPKGFYQSKPGQNHCIKCPGALSTDSEGSQDHTECKEMSCNSWKDKRSGLIQSPNFPLLYPANISCEWTIKSGGKRRGILIVISKLDIADDRCSDYLVIRKSRSPFSTVTYEACRSASQPLIFVARTRKLWIHFRSDGENFGTGFSLRYVSFRESIRPLIEDIVNDSELFVSPNHKVILENRQFLDALVDVVSQPNNYQKHMHLQRFFPNSFLMQMWPKIHRFFDLPDLEQIIYGAI